MIWYRHEKLKKFAPQAHVLFKGWEKTRHIVFRCGAYPKTIDFVFFFVFLLLGPIVLLSFCVRFFCPSHLQHGSQLQVFWRWNFFITLPVSQSVGWSVCHNLLKEREVSLPCSYRSTCFHTKMKEYARNCSVVTDILRPTSRNSGRQISMADVS